MTKRELLTAYREKVISLEELRHQIDRVGTDGRPGGCRISQTDRISTGTNNPMMASIHLAEGLEELAARMETELHALAPQVSELLLDIRDVRTYMVIQHYYVFAETDEQIGLLLAITKSRVNQIRQEYLRAV